MSVDKQITIRMPKELLAGWLTALRSGEYAQCTGTLHDGAGYCCLGVLAKVSGDMPDNVNLTSTWRDAHKVDFTDQSRKGEWAPDGPFLPALNCNAVIANDSRLHSFAEIADAIEACAEGV